MVVGGTKREGGRHVPSPRIRVRNWGDAESRAVLRDIAADLAGRTGFTQCWIEVVRSGGLVELVTIVGASKEATDRVGVGSDMARIEKAISAGSRSGPFTFVRADPTQSDAWQPQDMLIADVRDEAGDLRALVHLADPANRRRPSPRRLERMSALAAVPLRAALTVIEREAYAHHIWMLRATRRLLGSVDEYEDVSALARAAQSKLRYAFRASAVEIHLIDRPWDELLHLGLPSPILDELREAVMRAWSNQQALIIEAESVWNDDAVGQAFAEAMAQRLRAVGHHTLVVAPLGVDSEVLGAMFITRPPGGRRWSDAQIASVLDLGHDIGHTVVKARATRRERMLLNQLREQETLRSTFLRTIAHELKSPITVIRANAELLHDIDDPSQITPRVDAIERGVARLTDMVDDLAMLLKVTDSATDRPRTAVRPNDILADVVAALGAVAERADVVLEMWPGVGDEVLGDAVELFRAFTNIVDNAVKYSSPGDRVTVDVTRDDEMLVLTCRDEGIGISAADQEPLFTPFFRSTNEEALARPGSGLGLDIVRRIVERHGGRIHVSSNLGEGTTVRILLPRMTD